MQKWSDLGPCCYCHAHSLTYIQKLTLWTRISTTCIDLSALKIWFIVQVLYMYHPSKNWIYWKCVGGGMRRRGHNPRYPWVVGLIEWTLFKIGGRFEFFLLWLLFSRSHAVEPWTAVRKCFAVSQLSYVLLYSSLHFFDVAVVPDICRLFSLCLPCAMTKWNLNLAVTLSAARKRILRLFVNSHFSASTTHIGYIEQ